jgi:hypothetical protein
MPIKKLLDILLILLAVVLVLAGFLVVVSKVTFKPQAVYAGSPAQKVLLIHDSADAGGEEVFKQAEAALNYAKIAQESLDLSQGAALGELKDYTALVIATENVSRIEGAEAAKVISYVENGGGLTVLYRGWNPLLAELFGISTRQGTEYVRLKSAVEFRGDLFPGVQGLALPEEALGEFSTMDVTLTPDVEVIASSADGTRPFAWLNRYGKGRVLFWNTDWLAAREFRGFALQSVVAAQQAAAYSLVNAGIFYVDGFPGPLPAGKLEPIASEYDLSPAEFYHKAWYPDIMGLTRLYGLRYTWGLSFNENAKVSPPFDDYADWLQAKITVSGQEVPFAAYYAQLCDQSGEVALRGYNAQPLEAQTWGSADDMAAALESARQRWVEDDVGEMPFSYVAPGNRYSAEGLKALTQVFPSIKVVAGDGLGDFAAGGGRDFGPEPWAEGLFALPRWSSGYTLDGQTRLRLLSELGAFGAWTHAIRPGDLFDPAANPGSRPWRGERGGSDKPDGLYYDLVSLLDLVKKEYPWLRYLTPREAEPEFRDYLAVGATYNFHKAYEMVASFDGQPGYFMVRLNDGRRVDLSALINAQIVYFEQRDGYNIYLLRAVGNEVRVGLLLPEEE